MGHQVTKVVNAGGVPRGVGVLERVVEHIGVAVEALGVGGVGHERIRLHKAHEGGVVVVRPVVQQPRPVQPLPGVVVRRGQRALSATVVKGDEWIYSPLIRGTS